MMSTEFIEFLTCITDQLYFFKKTSVEIIALLVIKMAY